MEGGLANFSCTVLSVNSSTQVNSIWGVKVPDEIDELTLGDDDTVITADLKNSSTAFIGTPFNSLLTIANITRSLDGTEVKCFFFNKDGIQMFQEMPYAFLTVQCELFNVYTCCDIKQQTCLPAP